MDQQGIKLSEISQSGKEIPYDFTYVWTLRKKKQINKKETNKQTDS